jgi:hypothetical protein
LNFSIVHQRGYLEVKLSGRPTPAAFDEYFDALLAHDDWEPGMSVLTDETNLDGSTITVREVKDIAERCARRKSELGSVRTAILVARDLEYGMNRMWAVFVEGKWNVEVALFRSRDEALAWLSV